MAKAVGAQNIIVYGLEKGDECMIKLFSTKSDRTPDKFEIDVVELNDRNFYNRILKPEKEDVQ